MQHFIIFLTEQNLSLLGGHFGPPEQKKVFFYLFIFFLTRPVQCTFTQKSGYIMQIVSFNLQF